MQIRKYLITTALTLSVIALGANTASAGWRASHPRRAEVNTRLANQNKRINTEYKEGDITKSQAQDLHAEDRGVRAQERYDASNDGSHITKTEDRTLNRDENSVSRQIGQ